MPGNNSRKCLILSRWSWENLFLRQGFVPARRERWRGISNDPPSTLPCWKSLKWLVKLKSKQEAWVSVDTGSVPTSRGSLNLQIIVFKKTHQSFLNEVIIQNCIIVLKAQTFCSRFLVKPICWYCTCNCSWLYHGCRMFACIQKECYAHGRCQAIAQGILQEILGSITACLICPSSLPLAWTRYWAKQTLDLM